jgi:periodic tryptophan protein 1
LDLTEAIEPDLILGGEVVQKKKKPQKFNNGIKKYKSGSHTDSVLSLSLNHSNLSILASGSADSSLKIWDLSKQACIHTANHHKAKVKKVEWSKVDASVLFTCS